MQQIKPTKYQLLIKDGFIVLRFFAAELPKGESTIEKVQYQNGKSLPGLRQHGAKMAKRNGCTFEDLTGAAS